MSENKIGFNIKRIREIKNITRKELAEKSNISPSALANYENDYRNPNVEIIGNIANALEVPIAALIDDVTTNEFYTKTILEARKRDVASGKRNISDIDEYIEMLSDRDLVMNLAYSAISNSSDAKDYIIDYLLSNSSDNSIKNIDLDISERIELFNFLELSFQVKVKEIINKRKYKDLEEKLSAKAKLK